MSRRAGTDGSLLPSLPWSLGALIVALAPHVPYLPFWITTAFMVCAAGRWLIELRRWRLPPAWLRIALSLACFVGVLASYESVSGVGPGSALLAVMAALKLLETRRRRDQFVLLFISIFLIMSSLLREQYLWSLPYLVVALLITMTAWLRMAAGGSARTGNSLRTSARLLCYSVPLMLTMWMFFPRLATPFWAVPITNSAASSGLSDTLNPGDISSLSLSNAVAFRVRFDGAAPPPSQRYWRGLVLQSFNGRSWSGRESAADFRARERIETRGAPVRYTVTMEPTQQHFIFALDIPYDWSLDKAYMSAQYRLAIAKPVDQRIVYDVLSYPRYRIDHNLPRGPMYWYTRLPESGNPRSRRLAEDLRGAAGSDRQYIESVLQHFSQQEFFYTLEPPRLGADAVDEFLFETRRGFCEHYASSFAVLMRAAGIPARIVLGYQGGEMNPLGEYLIVRQSDAHAWTEVWLEGRGWLRVDPTAAVAPERIEAGMSGAMFDGAGARWGLSAPALWLHRLTLTWDAVNAKWNEWILGYGPDNQTRFMRWLGMNEPNWRKMLLTLLATLMLAIIAVSLILAWRYRPRRRDDAARLYDRFVRKTGLTIRRGETPLAFAARLRARDSGNRTTVDTVTARYLQVRYGSGDSADLSLLRAAVADYRPGS